MNKMNVSPPREKLEEKQSANDIEMKEEPQSGDLPQSPKVEPEELPPTEVSYETVIVKSKIFSL